MFRYLLLIYVSTADRPSAHAAPAHTSANPQPHTHTHTHTDRDADDDMAAIVNDVLSNLPLRSDLVDKAKQEEMEVFAKFPVYTKVPLQDAYHFTGKGPIETKWVDANKGN